MPRFTRSAAAVLLAASLAACATPSPSSTLVHSDGVFGPQQPIILDNLTVSDGRYAISVELDIFVKLLGPPVDFSCAVIDTSGRLGPLYGAGLEARSSRWIELTGEGVVELPDITLGLRCFPNEPAFLEVLVRTATIEAVPAD